MFYDIQYVSLIIMTDYSQTILMLTHNKHEQNKYNTMSNAIRKPVPLVITGVL